MKLVRTIQSYNQKIKIKISAAVDD
jgi:hypothetical protein